MQDAAKKPGIKIRRVVGVALSLAIHALLIALLLFRLPLPAAEPAKEEAVKVDIVDPPKPPDPPKPQKPVEQKKPRPPAPKQQAAPAPPPPSAAGAPSREEQAFEAGAPDAAADKPEDAPPPAAGEGRTASAPTVADKPVEPPALPKPSPTPPAAMALLRAKMQAEADAAKEADKPEAEKPQTETPPAVDAKPQEKPAPDTARTQGAPETPKGKDGAADVTLEKMTQAKTQYSKKMLSDPRVKQALGKLPPERRIVQICSIEALEQVRHAKPDAFPDLLVPFSTGGGLISGNVLDAKGGAFRAKDGWFEIAYRCSVDAQTTHVTDFRFELGGPVPRAQWAARKLPAE